MRAFVARLAHDSAGQDLIEYGLLAALVSLVAVVAIKSVGTALIASYAKLSADLP